MRTCTEAEDYDDSFTFGPIFEKTIPCGQESLHSWIVGAAFEKYPETLFPKAVVVCNLTRLKSSNFELLVQFWRHILKCCFQRPWLFCDFPRLRKEQMAQWYSFGEIG